MPSRRSQVHPVKYNAGLPPTVPRVGDSARRKLFKSPGEGNGTPLNNAPIASPYTPVQNGTPPGGVGKDETPPSTPRPDRRRIQLSPGDNSAVKQTPRQPPDTPAFLSETHRYINEFIQTTISSNDFKLIDFFDRFGLLSRYDTEFIDLELYQQIIMEHYLGIKPSRSVHLNWDLLSKTFNSHEASDGRVDAIFKSLCTHIIPNADTNTKLDPDGSIRLLNKAKKRYKARLLAKVVETIHQLVDDEELMSSEDAKQLTSNLIDLGNAEEHHILNGLLPQSTIDGLELHDLPLHSKEATNALFQKKTQQTLTEQDCDAILNLYAFSKLRENSEFDNKSNSLLKHLRTSLSVRTNRRSPQRTAQMIHKHIQNLSNLSVHHLVPINIKAINWLIYIYTSYTSFFDKHTAKKPHADAETKRSIADVILPYNVDVFEHITHAALYNALERNQQDILRAQEELKNPQPAPYNPNFWFSGKPNVHYKSAGDKFTEIETAFTQLGCDFFGDRMFCETTNPPDKEALQERLTHLFSLFIKFSCLILPYASGNHALIQLLNEKTNDTECRCEANIIRDIWTKFRENYLNAITIQNKMGLLFFELKKNWPNYHLAPYLSNCLNALQLYDIGRASGIKISETTSQEKKRKKEVLVSCQRMSGLITTLAIAVLQSADFRLPTNIIVPASKHISSSEDAPQTQSPCLPNIPLHSRQIPLAEYSRKAMVDLAQFETEEKAWIAGIVIGCIFGGIPGLIVLGCYIHRKKVLEGRVEETNRLEQEREGRAPHTEMELRRQFQAPSKWSKSPNLFHCGNRTRSRSNRRVRKRNRGWGMDSHEELDPDAKFSEITVI